MLCSWLLWFTFPSLVVPQEPAKSPPSALAAAVSAAADEHAASARILALEMPVADVFDSTTAKPTRVARRAAYTSLPESMPLPAAEASAAIAAAATAASAFAENVALGELALQGKPAQPAPDPGCWQDGYSAELCCRDPPVTDCWDAVFTRQRCCAQATKPQATGEPHLSAEVAAVVAAAAARNVQAGEHQELPPRKELSEANEQQVFLRQEAQRRWPAYFNRAHETLNAAQGSSPGQPSSKPDPVQLYHLLYESINQVVGGLALAADASQSDAELNSAFLNAAVLLARLARASRGTPLEHEDFSAQASAAAALGCRHPGSAQCNLTESLRRLEMPPEIGIDWLREALREMNASQEERVEHLQRYQRTWLKYSQNPAKALWRPAGPDGHQGGRTNTYNPLETGQLRQSVRGSGSIWQLFPTLQKYQQFRDTGFAQNSRQDDVNNAFFNWQLTHDAEQEEDGSAVWPELYRDSKDFQELKALVKLSSLEYLQQIYSATLSDADLAQLELSIWASVTPPSTGAEDKTMGLAFHDHPLALLSGVFYAEAGGELVADRTPTVFADPRGTTAFRYTRMRSDDGEATLEPTAPFHRLAYAHPRNGLSLVFPSWLVHGVAQHRGPKDRVVFAYNLHSLPGTTLASWAKTTL